MRILGIDPGSLHCGYALLEDLGGRFPLVREAGVWHLGDRTPLPRRLADLQERMEAILRSQNPQVLALEESFVHKNVRTAMVLGHARGVIIACCARSGLEVFEYAPSSVKQAVAGSGRASKEGVADLVRRQLGLVDMPDSADATDALAIALTHHLQASSPLSSRTPGPRRNKTEFDLDAYLARIGRKA